MGIIPIELEDELIKKLSPHRNRLGELLELGLQVLEERERQKNLALYRALERSGKVQAPEPEQEAPYVRHSLVSVRGQDVSEIVIEQRLAENPNQHPG